VKTLVVVGAGPMGLEAALGGLRRGFEVTVLEKGRVGESFRRYGPTRLFSPFSMNVSTRARDLLGDEAPAAEALLTGLEMAERVLEPLAAAPPLAGRILTGHTVTAIGRARMTRRDMPGHPLRGERPFRILVETPRGEEVMEADAVLDASGVYGRPAAVGVGGIPARGERGLDGALIQSLDRFHAALGGMGGRDVLLVGHGHSAAGAVAAMAALANPPRVVWATRSANRRPCVEIASDPLPERARVTARANDLACDPPPFLTVERRAGVEAFAPRDGRVAIAMSGGRSGVFDAVLGFTGYRPDLSFLSELALEVSPQSEGALGVARALAGVTDCLAVPKIRPADLDSGEPGFHLVGAKSYGRLPTFLLRNGLEQLESVLDRLAASS
jgi:thioredoxin reductase